MGLAALGAAALHQGHAEIGVEPGGSLGLALLGLALLAPLGALDLAELIGRRSVAGELNPGLLGLCLCGLLGLLAALLRLALRALDGRHRQVGGQLRVDQVELIGPVLPIGCGNSISLPDARSRSTSCSSRRKCR